ncbi:hypothetical protein PilKf_02396 [Pillotina sp. SPG140]|jgi:hypothetical protein
MHWTLSDLIADISQNACESGADTVELSLEEGVLFRFTVKDNGKGMSSEALSHAIDPFVTDGIKHPHRKIGLGLPFLIHMAEQSGGGWHIDSQPGSGTTVTAWFDTNNIDMPPLGDLPGMFRTVLLFPGPREFIISYTGKQQFTVKKSDLHEILGDFEDAGTLVLLDQFLRSQW